MAFHVGQKVVCVDDDWGVRMYGEKVPRKGSVYTVRDVVQDASGMAIRLCEIVNKHYEYADGLDECTFSSSRFRPLTDTKKSTETGMEILREIVRNPKTPALSKQPEGVV